LRSLKNELEEFSDLEAEVVISYTSMILFMDQPMQRINNKLFLVHLRSSSHTIVKNLLHQTQLSTKGQLLCIAKVGGVCHEILATSGYLSCSKCHHDVCSFCQGSIGMDTCLCCFVCAATESLIPEMNLPTTDMIESKQKILINSFQAQMK